MFIPPTTRGTDRCRYFAQMTKHEINHLIFNLRLFTKKSVFNCFPESFQILRFYTVNDPDVNPQAGGPCKATTSAMFPTGLFLAQLTRSATSVLLCLAGRQLHWLHALGLQNDIVLSATTAGPAEIRQKFTIVSSAKSLNPECLPARHKRLLTASYIMKQVKILSIFQGFSATLLGKECFITWIFILLLHPPPVHFSLSCIYKTHPEMA